MLSAMKRALSAYEMLDGVKEVTVALSGGADSVALLHALLDLQKSYGYTVYAAHLNHGLRGGESDADAAFVAALCKEWNVPLFAEKRDVASFAAEQKQGIELAARNVRYAFLQSVARGKIATAHTADDNAETVLFNISRGAALSGVCGIPPVRDRMIRPLIFCTRAQIETYCAEHALNYCTDSTNADQQYARNRIRHSVLPQLRQINSGCVSNISRMSELLRGDADYLDSVSNEVYAALLSERGLSVEELKKLHPAILLRVLANHCKNRTGITTDALHLQQLCKLLDNGTRMQIAGKVFAVKSGGFLDFDDLEITPPLYKSLGDDFKALSFEGLVFSYNNTCLKKVNNFVYKNSFDCAKIKGKLVMRHRLPGDALHPAGRNGTKALKKLFNEAHLPLSKRGVCRILADDLGIVWAEGFSVDQRVCISELTEQFVTVKISDDTAKSEIL